MSLCPHGYTAFRNCPFSDCPAGDPDLNSAARLDGDEPSQSNVPNAAGAAPATGKNGVSVIPAKPAGDAEGRSRAARRGCGANFRMTEFAELDTFARSYSRRERIERRIGLLPRPVAYALIFAISIALWTPIGILGFRAAEWLQAWFR